MRNLSSPSWRGAIIAYAPVVLWIGLIFYLSSDQGSMSSTSRFIEPLLHFLFPAAPEEIIKTYHGYIRKVSHFGVYAVLALLLARAFLASAVYTLKSGWLFASITCVLVIATLDELNQALSFNRIGSPSDVMLDLLGGACAVFALFLLRRRFLQGN